MGVVGGSSSASRTWARRGPQSDGVTPSVPCARQAV